MIQRLRNADLESAVMYESWGLSYMWNKAVIHKKKKQQKQQNTYMMVIEIESSLLEIIINTSINKTF